MLIGIAGWVICGALIGFILSKAINLRGDDPRLGIAVAAVGGLIGGWMYSLISGSPVTSFNVWSIMFASIAALVAMIPWHVVRSRRPYQRQSVRRSY